MRIKNRTIFVQAPLIALVDKFNNNSINSASINKLPTTPFCTTLMTVTVLINDFEEIESYVTSDADKARQSGARGTSTPIKK